ncbi:MAG: hypothetical protein ACI84D_000143 [Thalassolituus oleivorans]|jgi:hypothetical protein
MSRPLARRRIMVVSPICLMKSTLLAVALTLLVSSAYSQPDPGAIRHPGPIQFQHQNAEQINQATTILQDHEGFMWFGQWSGGGVFRFDGSEYTE